MASYRVSYKLLRQQGDELMAVGKTLDEYAERVSQIRSKLGTDEMLEPIRANLQKLQQQLGESRTVLNIAGNLLSKSVDSYSGVELRQVKKVDAIKAHNRDFYKNPIVVASAGGGGGVAAAGVAGAAKPAATTTNTYNYTDNTTNISNSTPAAKPQPVTNVPASAAAPAASAEPLVHTQTTASAPVSTAPRAAAPSAPKPAAAAPTPAAAAPKPTPQAQSTPKSSGAGTTAAIIGGGAAAAAGAVAGGVAIKKKRDANKHVEPGAPVDEYDPEAELARAIQRVRELEAEE